MNSFTRPLSTTKNTAVNGRQIAFFAAFVLPVYKLLETPSLLAQFAQGDLLLPAFLQFAVETGLLIALLYAASRSEKTLIERFNKKLGKVAIVFYALYAVYFLFFALLPLLDLEKFVYAVFYDTSPTLFSFAFFFIFAAFLASKGVKSLGRIADLALFLFLVPFFALLFMALVEAKFTNLLPLFEQKFQGTVSAFTYTKPHFSDIALLLPLIGNLRFEKKDGVKIVSGYLVGAAFTLLFLAVFYGLYSTIASREHYAFAKIAQYFPALSVIGRVDLLFVYMLCITLFFYVATPLQYVVDFSSRATGMKSKWQISAIVCLATFFFVLFFNKYYDTLYAIFCEKLFFIYIIFELIPLVLLFLPKTEPNQPPVKKEKKEKKEKQHA